MITSVLVTFKIHHWKYMYNVSNTVVSFICDERQTVWLVAIKLKLVG